LLCAILGQASPPGKSLRPKENSGRGFQTIETILEQGFHCVKFDGLQFAKRQGKARR
jgi:hypothetical protein